MSREKSSTRIIEVMLEEGKTSEFLLCLVEQESEGNSEVHLEILPITNAENSYKAKFSQDIETLTILAQNFAMEPKEIETKKKELQKELMDALFTEECSGDFKFSMNSEGKFICHKEESFCGNMRSYECLEVPLEEIPYDPVVAKNLYALTTKLKSVEMELKKRCDPIEQVQMELDAIVREKVDSEEKLMKKTVTLVNNLKRKYSELQGETEN